MGSSSHHSARAACKVGFHSLSLTLFALTIRLSVIHVCQQTVQPAVDLDAYAKVGLAHMSCSPLLVHVQSLIDLRAMLQVLHCASCTVAPASKGTSEASCVGGSFRVATEVAFTTASKGASLVPVAAASRQNQDLGRERSFEDESSRTSSEGLRASGQLHKADQGQWPDRQRASRRATSAYSGISAAHRPASTGSGSDLDISCLTDNTPFKINEVCCTFLMPDC